MKVRSVRFLVASIAALGLEWLLWMATSSYVDDAGAWRQEGLGDHIMRFIVLTTLFAGIIAFIMLPSASANRKQATHGGGRIVHDTIPPSKREN